METRGFFFGGWGVSSQTIIIQTPSPPPRDKSGAAGYRPKLASNPQPLDCEPSALSTGRRHSLPHCAVHVKEHVLETTQHGMHVLETTQHGMHVLETTRHGMHVLETTQHGMHVVETTRHGMNMC